MSKRKKIKGTVIVYLSKACPHCMKIHVNKETVRELYLKYFESVSFRFVEDNLEFIAYDFSRVPTLVLPGYRPFEAIRPEALRDEDYLVQMISGSILPEDVIHETEQERRHIGEIDNKNLDKLLGR